MNQQPDEAKDKSAGSTGPEPEKRTSREDKPPQPKKKPGDAARKMREMFKGTK